MLTPDYYEHIADDLIDIYSALDDAIISVVAKRIAKFGDLSETSIWQLQQLSENGGVYDDVLKEIARRSNKSEQELRNIFKQAGLEATANDYHSVARTFSNKLSPSAIQMLNAGYRKCQGNLKNLTLTTANTSQSAYITACNNAYMQIVSGAFSYQTAIRDAIKSVAQTGTEVLYSSGRRDKLDVAVRRSVLTGVGQTVRTLSEMNAEDLECDLMEITAHAGARPSHAQWQGQLVSLSGRRGYLSKDDIGYGRGDGFGGWNCRHDWHPFFEGISKRAYSSSMLKQLNARDIEYKGKKYTEYEITQMQRKYERDIRSLKREAIAYDEAADSVEDEQLQAMLKQEFAEVSVKLKEKEKQLKQFVKDTGQLRDRFREQVYGFGRSTAQKAVWAERKALTERQNDGKIKIERDNGVSKLFRKPKPDNYIEPMPKKQLRRIVKAFSKQGGIIQMSEETDNYLDSKNAEAITYNEKTILFRQKPGRASVFEELIHTAQYRNGENDGEYESRLRCEIYAQKKLIKYQKAYKLTLFEVEQTKQALRDYESELEEYLKRRE